MTAPCVRLPHEADSGDVRRKVAGPLTARAGGAATVGGASPAGASTVPDPLPADEFELMVVDAGKLWISRRDQVMRPYLARAGSWEPEEGRVLLALTKPGCRFLDIGANIGYFSVLVDSAAPGVLVDAVEPDPTNVRVLRFKFSGPTECRGRCGPWRSTTALGASISRTTSTTWETFGPVTSRSTTPEQSQMGGPGGKRGRAVRGKSFDLVKIDTQGWEFEILLGLDLTLRRSAGVRIVAEFCPQILRDRGRDPLEILARYHELGYAIRSVIHGEPTGLVDAEIMQVCLSGGREGQVNLLLSR